MSVPINELALETIAQSAADDLSHVKAGRKMPHTNATDELVRRLRVASLSITPKHDVDPVIRSLRMSVPLTMDMPREVMQNFSGAMATRLEKALAAKPDDKEYNELSRFCMNLAFNAPRAQKRMSPPNASASAPA